MARTKSIVVLLAFMGAAHAAPDPSLCDTLPAEPINNNVIFEQDIQPIFTGPADPKCTTCHSPNSSGTLSLSPGAAHGNLVNVNSAQDASIKRVLPFDAAGSLLFRKVNCGNPGVGSRMPRGRTALSLDQQRLIRDWINQGAIKNAIFASTFE